MYGDKNMFSKFVDYFSKDKTVQFRTKALLCFLPKWSGFLVNEATEKLHATDALAKLDNVVECLTNVWIEESGYPRQKKPTNFDVRKVICQAICTNCFFLIVKCLGLKLLHLVICLGSNRTLQLRVEVWCKSTPAFNFYR